MIVKIAKPHLSEQCFGYTVGFTLFEHLNLMCTLWCVEEIHEKQENELLCVLCDWVVQFELNFWVGLVADR